MSNLLLVLGCVALPIGILSAWMGVVGGGRDISESEHGIAADRGRALASSVPRARLLSKVFFPVGVLLLVLGLLLRVAGL